MGNAQSGLQNCPSLKDQNVIWEHPSVGHHKGPVLGIELLRRHLWEPGINLPTVNWLSWSEFPLFNFHIKIMNSGWVLRLLHGVTGRGAAAWPHSRPAVSIFGGQATTLPIAVFLSAEERQRQIVARSCSRPERAAPPGTIFRRWRVLWSPRPSATVLTPRGACDLGRAAEQCEEPSNHGFTLSRPGGTSEKRRQPARWEWYVGEPNVLFPAPPPP